MNSFPSEDEYEELNQRIRSIADSVHEVAVLVDQAGNALQDIDFVGHSRVAEELTEAYFDVRGLVSAFDEWSSPEYDDLTPADWEGLRSVIEESPVGEALLDEVGV
jgi:hypothetical protein